MAKRTSKILLLPVFHLPSVSLWSLLCNLHPHRDDLAVLFGKVSLPSISARIAIL